jgi:SAM-dependent methyltransferase
VHDFPIRDMILYTFSGVAGPRKVLEIGPGSGITAFTLSRFVGGIAAVEVAAEAVAGLKEALSGCTNVEVILADLSKPGVSSQVGRDNDLAYALDVLEYVPTPEAFLRNVSESLSDEGEAFITFPNVPPPVGDGVTYFTSQQEIADLFKKAGFSEIEVFAVELTPYAKNAYWLFHELPLKVYRSFRTKPATLPQTYEQTWAFTARRKLLCLRPILHGYWRFISVILRLGGTTWRQYPIENNKVLGRQLVIRAWK